MAQDKTGTWSSGESILWYSPTTGLDATWSLGESYLEDEYEYEITENILPLIMNYYRRMRGN